MKVGVFGLGYVGIVNLVCFAELGHTVIGCDIKTQKVDAVLQGKSPVSEPGVEELLAKGLAEGRIHATNDAQEVISQADVLLICVGTPSNANGSVNLDFTFNTTIEIGRLLAENPRPITIAYRSTIPPGTVEGKLKPLLERQLGSSPSMAKVAFYPEFLREGSAVKDFMEAPRIVLGTRETEIDQLRALVSYNPNSPVVVTTTETGEFVKYVDNAFHALKIGFANEIYRLGNNYGVDISVANDIFLMDQVLNISQAYLRPGLPFGGSCLPKDLRALGQMTRDHQMELPILNNILYSNQCFQRDLIELIKDQQKQKILLVGLTFKNHTDDVRESPMLKLAHDLIGLGYALSIYDEDINERTLRIEQPGIVKYIDWNLDEMMSEAELIIVCKRYMDTVATKASINHVIINMANTQSYQIQAELLSLYQ